MFTTIQFVPGAVLAGVNINLPAWARKIDAVTSAQIIRPTSLVSVGNHAAADVIAALDDHAAADVIAALDDHAAADVIAAIDDHAVHGHDITTVAAAGGGSALTEPAAATGSFESAGGGKVNAGAVDVLAAAQGHGATATPVAHAASATPVAHAASATPVSHALTGTDPIVAAVPTKVDEDTITLDVPTVAGDILLLSYIAQGSKLSVA